MVPMIIPISMYIFFHSLLTADSMDISAQGHDIILQHDVETLLVSTNLGPSRVRLTEILNGIKGIKKNLVSDIRNALLKDQKMVNRAILDTVRADELTINFISRQYTALFTKSVQEKDKRAFELLGSFLSTMTGVPSARDHRKMLEQIRAIRFSNKGLEKLMTDQNAQNGKLLERLHLHETDIAHTAATLNDLVNNTERLASHLHKAFALISVGSKVMHAATTTNYNVIAAKEIIGKGDMGLLSRHAIPVVDLIAVINKIHVKRQTDGPIFGRESVHKYYELKLAHSWADPVSSKVYTLLQIPIASLKEIQSLHILDKSNMNGNVDLHLAVLNKQSNSYRLLTNSDYMKCTQLDQARLCQKRMIQIFPRLGCSVRLMNCPVWTTDVVHDLSNSEILLSLTKPMNASLDCDNKQTQKITLPMQAIIRLSIHCSLTAETFIVSKITFKHLANYNTDSSEHFLVLNEREILKGSDLEIKQVKLAERVESIESLQKDNEKFKKAMADHIEISDSLWKESSGGQTPWEQIITWALIGLSLFIGLFLGTWTVKLQIQMWKSGKSASGKNYDDMQKEIDSLKSRMMDLETDVQLAETSRRPPAYNPISKN